MPLRMRTPHTTARLILDGTGFNRAFDLPMEPDLDRADFRKAEPAIVGQGIATLGIGEGIVAVASLEAGIARLLAILHAAEEVFKRPIQAQEHILKHLAVNILVLWPDFCLDLRQIALLLVVADRLAHYAIGISPFGKRGVVEFPAAHQRPEEFLLLVLRWIEPEFVGFPHRFFCPST